MNDADDSFCGNCRAPVGTAAVSNPMPAVAPAAGRSTPKAAAAASVAPVAPPKPGEIACPNCGTSNAPTRLFCVKCATQLRAEAVPAKKSAFRPNRGMIVPFLLSAVIGLGAAIGGARIGAIVLARAPQATGAGGSPAILPGASGAPVGFNLTPADPKPVDTLPPDKTIRLADYKVPTPSEANDPDHQAPWWNDTVPRIPAISQFDGGPLQGVNCVMASGAMLARLAFGIVTTGSQLRALQTDQDGASSYGDLDDAVQKGWGVGFLRGLLTATQLRALSYAGAGIVVSLDYGAVPENVRLQRSFTGNHSVYIDAFTASGPDGRPAYWVMDPIGHAWAGYKGGWWPAEDIERAGMSRSGGKIYATWAFAGGIVPDRHRVLPPDAYPGGSTAAPSAAPTEATATADPMPSGDVDVPVDDPDTGTPPPEIPPFLGPININTNLFIIEPEPDGLACTVQPIPQSCPGGIIGVLGPGGANDPTAPLVNTIDVLYGTVIAPGTIQIVFESPPNTTGGLWTWSGSGLPVLQSIAQPAVIGTTDVSVATISVSTSGTLSFFTTATSSTYSGISTMGSLVVGS
ncbi:MAG TPA: zinc ribbon domain-containing protein [Candidatus Limnocylindrales bacterium]|nr:zinc ribbon domain-containing protein [Candidatus Limnocylindrales bacterium]